MMNGGTRASTPLHHLSILSHPETDLNGAMTPDFYEELRGIACALFARESRDHTLQPTALVNEVYLRLIEQNRSRPTDRKHLRSLAAMMMRRLLVDHARKRRTEKHGGDQPTVSLSDTVASVETNSHEEAMLSLDGLLDELAKLNPRHAKVVELRYFAGLTIPETAEALGISDFTVKSDWRVAKAWLLAQLAETDVH